MQNELTPFIFGASTIRTITNGNAVWFSAQDICAALGIQNHRESLRHLDEDEKGVISNDTLGGQQKISVVNESGLYALVLRSRKPEAHKFAKWVTSEVLPSIRKSGSYSDAPAPKPTLSLRGRRWLVHVDSFGNEQVNPIDSSAAILKYEDLPALIADPAGTFSNELIAQIGEACSKRLTHYAANFWTNGKASKADAFSRVLTVVQHELAKLSTEIQTEANAARVILPAAVQKTGQPS